MNFGINLATSADSWRVVKRAEELGYTRPWFYDTQLLNADMFVPRDLGRANSASRLNGPGATVERG
jgi:5,10-methylenetetrahydromethanopterin reductase